MLVLGKRQLLISIGNESGLNISHFDPEHVIYAFVVSREFEHRDADADDRLCLVLQYPSNNSRHVLVFHRLHQGSELNLGLCRRDIWPNVADLANEVMSLDLRKLVMSRRNNEPDSLHGLSG